MSKTVRELILEYFKAHPRQELEHGPVVDWVTERWKTEHTEPPRDPWRSIRSLHQQGILIKVSKGVYKYDPSAVKRRELDDFTPQQKEEIFKRDGYRCVLCGLGRADGVEICADHIIPKELNGKAEVANGQTLCMTHNLRKKYYKQTETGKRMFIRLYDLAISQKDRSVSDFCREVLELYEKHHVNDHIEWEH